MLLQILYVSECRISAASLALEIEQLLEDARLYNRAHGITGCLTCENGLFVQVLEGNDTEVEVLLARIVADPRHGEVVVRMRREVRARSFPDWRMAHFHPEQAPPAVIADNPWRDPRSMPTAMLLAHLMALADHERG